MTLSEFKAWFEGFTEDMSGAPTEKQFKKIKARVAEITGNPVTERHFYDHYWHRYYEPYRAWYSSGTAAGLGVGLSASNSAYNLNSAANNLSLNNKAWDVGAAMLMLGKVDALADAA